MPEPPFITPGRSANARRRGPGQWWKVAAALLGAIAAIAAGLLAAHLAAGSAHGEREPPARHAVARNSTEAHATTARSARRSAIGLPLGTPALTLGLRGSSADPIHPGFVHPPRAGLLFDLRTGRVLWQLHPHRRLRIASLTKMMTSLIAVETDPPGAKVLITKQAVDMPGSKVGELPLGKRVSLLPLLYGLLLPSGNDAAVAIAQHVGGSVPAFVKEMNAEAARRGLSCTRYSSPSGYYDAGNFSCAADLAVLAYDDLSQPLIAKITGTASVVLPFPIKGGKLYLDNDNPLLLYGYPGTTGLKTGYTEAAGRCLVATARRDGIELGVVLLHSPAPGTQAARLLTDAFNRVYRLPPVKTPPIPAGL